MKSFKPFFVAVVAGLTMCLASAGYAQHQILYPKTYTTPQAYWNAFDTRYLPYANNVRGLFGSAQQNWFHDTHAVSWFDVGRIYERIHNSNTVREYTGPINWVVHRYGGGSWAQGTQTHSNPGSPPFGPDPTNIIRVTRGALNGPAAGTIPAGAIYALTAELDGEFYGGHDRRAYTHNDPPVWAMNTIWTFPNGNSGACSSANCTRWTPALVFANAGVMLSNPHEIYIHPRSTVQIINAPSGVPVANQMVRYVFNQDGARKIRWQKPTNNQGWCHFNVNWRPTDEGFSVFYDGCWHPIPRRLAGCTNL